MLQGLKIWRGVPPPPPLPPPFRHACRIIIVLQFPTQRSVTKRKILEDVVVFFFLPLDGAKEWLCQFVYEMRNGQRNQIRDLHSEFWQNWALHLHDTFMCFSFSCRARLALCTIRHCIHSQTCSLSGET